MSEAAFDYSRAARDAGWERGNARWIIPNIAGGCSVHCARWVKIEGNRHDAFEGTDRELCFHIGKGPEFEAWKQDPYKMNI